MFESIQQPAPAKAVRVKRLTPALKAIPVDQDKGVKLDFNTARCLRAYADHHGWSIVQKRDGDHVIVWRIG